MHKYQTIFDARGAQYNSAGEFLPNARETERALLLGRLDLKPGLVICDAPAGGGYVADGISKKLSRDCRIICIEPSKSFAQAINPEFETHIAPLENIPLDKNSADRATSLAGIHHLENKLTFFKEVFRILKPGGLFAVADVQKGSQVAKFLNDSVDRWTETGHKGIFLENNELTSLLKKAGFQNTRERYENFSWTFPNPAVLVKYCSLLFGMAKADIGRVETELKKYFSIRISADSAELPWSLIYAVGIKPI